MNDRMTRQVLRAARVGEPNESLKAVGDTLQSLIKAIADYQHDLPLKYIILRSLVVSLSKRGVVPMIIHKDIIVQVAEKLDMDEKEIEEFLTTFTDFGSILYIPQFDSMKHLVIVDIFQFTKYLDKLFYPDASSARYANHLMKYGIISKASTKELLEIEEENFMQIVTTFAMAAQVTNGNPVLLPDETSLFNKEDYYYLPSARVRGPDQKDEECDYAFLEIRSVNFPANVQACISHAIMKNNDVYILATEESNVSCFEFRPEGGPVIQIKMIYGGSRTRLRVTNNTNDILTSPATVRACSHVLIACCNCLSRKINLIRNLQYNVGIPCCADSNGYHFLYSDDQSNICEDCRNTDNPNNQFRLCWIEAARMINQVQEEIGGERKPAMLTKDDITRLKQDTLKLDDIIYIGKLLSTQDFNVQALCEKLGVKIDAEEAKYAKDRLAITLLMKWENTMNGKAYKNTLAHLLKDNYPEIAQILLQGPNSNLY